MRSSREAAGCDMQYETKELVVLWLDESTRREGLYIHTGAKQFAGTIKNDVNGNRRC